ncbi:MAG: lamin tail domain-containing protein [Candidatus Paceibacterota bacterium]|jgi:hypothetical protein
MKKIIFVAVLLLVPNFVSANVRINEVAWMGDSLSAYNEWIELYNDGDAEQNLSGWAIVTTDGKFSAALSKTIQPKGYFLLEHVKADATKSTASDVLSYTGTYFNNNGGIILLLKNGDIEIDKIDATEKWAAGNPDKSKEQTMQRDESEWVTAPATKKTAYVPGSALSDTTTDTTTDTNNDTALTSSSSRTFDTSAHVSPLSLSDFSQKQELYISAGRNRIVSVGSPILFEAYAVDAKGEKSQNISAAWSFGDGAQAKGAKVSHTYKYSGDYVVVLNAVGDGNEAVSRASVRVFSPKIILLLEEDGAVSLANDSAYEINIGDWKIRGMNGSFVASLDTIVLPGKKIIFSKANTAIDFSKSASMELLFPDGVIAASFAKIPTPIVAVASTTFPIISASERITEPPAIVKIVQPFVSSKPKQQTAAAASVAVSEPEELAVTAPAQKIILKKPEGFFTKIWHFFFR